MLIMYDRDDESTGNPKERFFIVFGDERTTFLSARCLCQDLQECCSLRVPLKRESMLVVSRRIHRGGEKAG